MVTVDWQMIRDLVYLRGSRISDTMEKKAGVPAKAKTSEEQAEIDADQPLLATILKSEMKGCPSFGAAAGRSWTPTATVSVKMAQRIPVKPTQAIQLILPSVWILAKQKPAMAATATKTAVQVPCVERELSAIEMPNIPAPATKIQYKTNAVP